MPETLTDEPAVLPHPHATITTPSRPEAQWLVLEYLAADNDLEGELLAELIEMERVGSTPGVVEILAQVDRSPGRDARVDWVVDGDTIHVRTGERRENLPREARQAGRGLGSGT